MRSTAEIQNLIPHDGDHFDVIVAGGGPAGIGAAVAASISGAKTLLLEDRGFLGGVATVSSWMPMNRLLLNGGSRGATCERFVEKMRSMGPKASYEGHKSWVDGDCMCVHPEYLRLACVELLEDCGCSYLLHSPVTGAVMDGNRVKGVVCDGKYGKHTYYAGVFVDCSGDGDLAYAAGVPMRKGRETDGVFMPITMGFIVGNVDLDTFFNFWEETGYSNFTKQLQDQKANGYATSAFYSFYKGTVPNTMAVNNAGLIDVGVVDASKIEDLNFSLRTGMQVAVDFVEMVKEMKVPGLENCHLVRMGPELGIRETRRIEGVYTMTLEDAQMGKTFDDVICCRYGTIDPGGLKEAKDYHGSIRNGHQFPYSCLLPKEVDGLLVAGRCSSQTHLAAATCKSMGNMMAMGQGAGVAAAICAKEQIEPRNVDIKKVHDALHALGVTEI